MELEVLCRIKLSQAIISLKPKWYMYNRLWKFCTVVYIPFNGYSLQLELFAIWSVNCIKLCFAFPIYLYASINNLLLLFLRICIICKIRQPQKYPLFGIHDCIRYSKIPLSRTWVISNTPLMSKLIAGPGCFHCINDFKNSWYLDHGYFEYLAYLEVYLWSQTLILPRLSRSAVKFLVCLTYLATLRYQFTPATIYIHYNFCFVRRSLILRCPRSVN
jgi:hypothetical protein